jgi:hypothetical protein
MQEREKTNEPEEKSDFSVALELCTNIKNPCEAEVAPGQIESLRQHWIREARKFAEKTGNEFARKLIEETIAEYENSK